ncbi:MAG: hypothetical protein IJ273_02340 [Alphaproteobacteria bacterium]|nr:hypothetical protein [Alphaproteobacteria bacterium]
MLLGLAPAYSAGYTCSTTKTYTSCNANYYLSSGTCTACPSSYPYSAGGTGGISSCYKNATKTGSQLDPSLPTGCAAQSTTACTPGTCTYKDYYSGTDGTCTPTNCTKTHSACTSASANYYLASGVAKTCSSYSSSYPSSAGGNITSSSCYGSFSKSGSQNACSQPANSVSYSCNTCTPGTCSYTKYASGTIKTDCSPSNCNQTVKSATCKANYYGTTSCTACSSFNSSYPYSDQGTTSSNYCYASKTNTGSQIACSKPANSASYTCNSCSPGTCSYRDYYNATDTTCSPSNCNQTVKSVTCNHGYNVSGTSCNPITVTCPAGQFMWHWSSTNGSTSCEPCHAGYYCPGGTNIYGSGSVNSANSAGVVTIYSCPSGYTSGGKGLSAQSQCQIAVAAGKYITAKNGTTTASCAAGTYRGAHNVNYGSTDSCTTCPSPNVGSSVYVCNGTSARTSPVGATAATQCYLDSSIADYWTHNASYHGFYRCSGKQYYSSSTGYYSSCESKKYFSECNAGYFIDGSTAYSSEFSNTCSICGAGTYTEKVSTASNIGDGSYHYQTSCSLCPAGTFNPNTGSTSSSACTACPSSYPNSDAGTGSSSYCYAVGTKTGTQQACSKPSNCASVTCGTCSPGTCNYRDYNGATDTTCTPTNCTKPVASVTANANRYVDGITCPACGSSYPYSDGGNISSSSCYTNITRGCTQNNGSTPSGCASVTAWNACSCAGGTYRKYASGSTSGTTSNETCTKTVKSVSANANRYVDGTTCPACGTSYPYSDGGNISGSYCYKNATKSGSQLACSQPANSASYTCGTCTVGTCSYRDYNGATDGSCTPDNCTQPVASVSCKANYYASGTTCPACPTAYPYSDAGTTSDGSCYTTKTNTGSQIACSKPANSASYACGTCTVGTCNWRDYKTATDTTCTPNNCTQPVSTVSCNTGYYKSGVTCPACTNKPANSSYTGTATSNSCPWTCNSGYNQTADNQCGQFCGAGITHLHLGNGASIPLYSSARTSPAINVKWNDTVCYGSLSSGKATGLNVKVGTTTYHAVN